MPSFTSDTALAWQNGQFLPADKAAVALDDAGFVMGATVSEQLRTFAGKLFCLPEHLTRLARSLEIIGIDLPLPLEELGRVATQLAEHNYRLLPSGQFVVPPSSGEVALESAIGSPPEGGATNWVTGQRYKLDAPASAFAQNALACAASLSTGHDLGVSLLVTPGPYATFASGRGAGPTIIVHTYPLPFHLWADKCERGQTLATTAVEQVSPGSWPRELKCRSRMHYYLADRLARQQDPEARALLLDAEGNLTETATANLLVFRAGEGLLSPPRSTILPGISLAFVEQLAADLGIAFSERPLEAHDLLTADEALLTSTPSCLLPVTRFNGQPIGGGRPGPVFRRLLGEWSRRVGVDIAAQAAQWLFCRRP